MVKLKLAGKVFGRLTVIKEAGVDKTGGLFWECVCACGNSTIVRGRGLQTGNTKSCGCLQKEITKGYATKHGQYGSPAYRTWQGMIQRCYDENASSYCDYGGRGIKVCRKWLNFKGFFKDMGRRPKGETIERIDNNKGYCLENCKWATWVTQARNKRTYKNNKIGIKGISWYEPMKRYRARIRNNGHLTHLGYFDDLDKAIEARRAGELKYWNKEYENSKK